MKLVCLVLEPIVLVAEDLSSMIDEVMPGTVLVVVPSVDRALEAVSRLGAVDVALVNAPPEGFSGSALGEALAQAGALVVHLGYEVEARLLGRAALERPFLTEAVAAVLRCVDDRAARSARRDWPA